MSDEKKTHINLECSFLLEIVDTLTSFNNVGEILAALSIDITTTLTYSYWVQVSFRSLNGYGYLLFTK